MSSADGAERGRAQGRTAARRPARVAAKLRVANRRSVTTDKRPAGWRGALLVSVLCDINPNTNIPHFGIWNAFIKSLRFFIGSRQSDQRINLTILQDLSQSFQ